MMKKNYMAPAVEINETEIAQMIALSIKDSEKEGFADDQPGMAKEDTDWNIWDED